MTNIHIYVACLESYNHGILYGKWIDAQQSEDEIMEEIMRLLSESPIPNAEEWAIHDYDGFGSYQVSEYGSIKTISDIANNIAKYGNLFTEVLTIYGDIDATATVLEEHYHGEYDSELEFATQLFDEIYSHEISDHIQHYIDYDAFARDLFINDYFSVYIDHHVHVFSNY